MTTSLLFPKIAKLLEFLLQVYEELQVCVLERACWLVPLQGAAAGCCCRVPPRGAASVRFGACLLMLLQGVAAGCPCRVLQGAAIRVVCALWSCPVAGCCCRAPLQGAAVRVVYALWSWPAGAAIGCCCRCCQSAVCLVVVQGRLGCCFRAARCAWQCGVLGLDGDYVYAVITSITFTQCQKAECLVAAQK